MNKVYFGDCRDSLRQMAKEGIRVQTCITSPPYYGLRDYGTGTWIGGDESCSHKRDSKYSDKTITGHANKDLVVGDAIYKATCPKCGAVRQDLQIGLEESPQEFVNNLVEVFAAVWDILEDDGTLWINIGDSYSGSGKGPAGNLGKKHDERNMEGKHSKIVPKGLKQKELIGIPWRLAFALQDFGWYLRQDIIWHKPNPMPESVQDRCTKAHEYIFLLTKKPKYYFDNESIKDPVKEDWGTRDRSEGKYHNEGTGLNPHTGLTKNYENANKRSVWSVNTKAYKGSHFAVYPEELVEPMVLASTSAKGHCPKCFARWKQIKIDTGERKEVEVYTGQSIKNYAEGKAQNPSDTKRRILESMSKVYEYQWISGCECNLDPSPDIVLDPFFGSGTTGAVAQKLGRKWIGCELNKDYEPLQFERLKQQALGLI